jgi:hypothetical protein
MIQVARTFPAGPGSFLGLRLPWASVARYLLTLMGVIMGKGRSSRPRLVLPNLP